MQGWRSDLIASADRSLKVLNLGHEEGTLPDEHPRHPWDDRDRLLGEREIEIQF